MARRGKRREIRGVPKRGAIDQAIDGATREKRSGATQEGKEENLLLFLTAELQRRAGKTRDEREFSPPLQPFESELRHARFERTNLTFNKNATLLHPIFAEHNFMYKCQSCGRSYHKKYSLIRHLRHECGGIRNFSCHLCPGRYTRNETLKIHLLKIHNVRLPKKRRPLNEQ